MKERALEMTMMTMEMFIQEIHGQNGVQIDLKKVKIQMKTITMIKL